MKGTFGYIALPRFIYRMPLFSRDVASYSDILNDDLFKEALYLASPSLFTALMKENRKEFSELPDKLKFSVLKYIFRISHRSTPFGLFAGCGTGQITQSGGSEIIVEGDMRHQTGYFHRTRLDMHFLCRLIDEMNKDKGIQEELLYFPNNTGYILADSYRYVESRYTGLIKKYYFSEVAVSPYLLSVLELCKEHGCKRQEIASRLTGIYEDIDSEEALGFVDSLIENQVIVSDLQPILTGKDLFGQIMDRFPAAQAVFSGHLAEVKESLDTLNRVKGPEERIKLYERLDYLVEKMDIPYDKKYLFQLDLSFMPLRATVDEKILGMVTAGLTVLNKFSPHAPNSLLEKFKTDFYSRYEEEEIPLAQVFDPDMGIDFLDHTPANTGVSPLLEELSFIGENVAGVPSYPSFNPRNVIDHLLLQKFHRSLKDNAMEIYINEDDLKGLSEDWDNLTDTFSTVFEIKKMDNRQVILLSTGSGSSAANILSRFSDANQGIQTIVGEILDREKLLLEEDTVYAEIVHLSHDRLGNVMCRAVTRDYEIPYLARESCNLANTLFIDDLMVSYRNGRVRIRSKKLNKFVKPILTNAHNFTRESLPIYHFLCMLQGEATRNAIYFSWSEQLSNEAFLPRVRYRDIILSPAAWNLQQRDWDTYNFEDDALFSENISRLRQDKGIPDLLYIVEADNKLFIDTNDPWSCRLFIDVCKGKRVKLEEYIGDRGYAFARGNNGRLYNSEIVICFAKDKKEKLYETQNGTNKEKIHGRG